MTTITLTGLRADNPLAFLAALGTLRVLTLARPNDPPRMGWTMHGGAWRPFVQCREISTIQELVERVHSALTGHCDDTPFRFADDTTVKPEVFGPFVRQAASGARSDDRRCADFAAAFGCEVLTNDQGRIADTALRTMSGAGHQHFLTFMRRLCECTTREHLHEALIGPWRRKDPAPSMRWDPADDRRYALRWSNPSGDDITTVRGANRLAVEAMPLLPTAPVANDLRTVGFTGVVWTWPVWAHAVPCDVVASVLVLPDLQSNRADPDALQARGVVALFRCRRITTGKYRNFSPCTAVL